MRVKVGTQRTVARLSDTDAGLKPIKTSFHPPNCQAHIQFVSTLTIQDVTTEAVPVEGSISLQLCVGDVHAGPWLRIFEQLAVDVVLGTSYIDMCIRGIFLTKINSVPIHFSTVLILTSVPKVMSLLMENFLGHAHAIWLEKHYYRRAASAVLTYSSLCNLMATADRVWQDVVDNIQLMIVTETEDILTGRPFHFYIANISALPILFLKNRQVHM